MRVNLLHKLFPFSLLIIRTFSVKLFAIHCCCMQQGYPIWGFGVLSDNVVVSALIVCCSLLLGYIGRRVLLTSWQKLHTVSRPTSTSEAMRRSALNLVEWWIMKKIEADQRGNLRKQVKYLINCLNSIDFLHWNLKLAMKSPKCNT